MKLSAQTHFSQGWSTRLLQDVRGMGIDAIRDSVPWHRVETAPGSFDFTHGAASWVSEAVALGFDVTLVFQPSSPLYDDGHTVYTAEGRAAFARYVVETLKASPGVTTIEIGNEYNGNDFVTGPIAAASKEKRDDYYRLMIAEVDKALVKAGLDVEVLRGAAHSIPADYFTALLAGGAIEAGDSISIHPYTTEPEQLAGQLALLRGAIGNDIAIHVTEFGDNFAKLSEAPGFLAKMVAVMADAGIASANWYAFGSQPWFPNMELWDRDANQPTPAGVTMKLMTALIDGASSVERIEAGSHTYLYTFGGNAAVVWGEHRAITLGAGVEAFDLAGRRLDSLAAINPDTPVILRSATGSIASKVSFGDSPLLADSFHDFDENGALVAPGEAGNGPWSYFARNGVGAEIELGVMGGGHRAGEPWVPYLGSSLLRPLQVGAVSITPAFFNPLEQRPDKSYAVVERFTADADALVTIRGHWDVADTSDDGVRLRVLLNGTALLDKHIFDKAGGHEFALALKDVALRAGDVLEFELGANANARGDVTERRIQIIEQPGPGQEADGFAPPTVNPFDHSDASVAVRVKGDALDNHILGGSGGDELYGMGGSDRLEGGAGDDWLYVCERDSFDGGAGIDSVMVMSSVGVTIDLAATRVENATGGGGNDVLDASGLAVAARLKGGRGDDVLRGGAERDTLLGDAGNDFLVGGAGNDRLVGGDGRDIIAGGRGNDAMSGGAGADRFVFEAGFGTDRITDFGAGDIIDLSALPGIRGIGDIGISYLNGRAIISIGEGRITLDAMLPGSLDAGDFIF